MTLQKGYKSKAFVSPDYLLNEVMQLSEKRLGETKMASVNRLSSGCMTSPKGDSAL